MQAAVLAARAALPERLHGAAGALAAMLLDPGADGGGPTRAELAVRFQQTCGPVMAKGVEDTAFYRWSRLSSLNEVGGEPGQLGITIADFHRFAARLARDWPVSMTTLSTHDTKRGEDMRARLAVLAERPAQWAAQVAAWHERAVTLAGGPAATLPEPDTEYLLWQTLAGAWPVGAGRLAEYLRKAMREAKTRTSWTAPDEGYESAVLDLARAILADAGRDGLAGQIAGFVAGIEPDARVNSLGAKLVQLTMPGVPDVYQGCELGSYSLVDPDNRRPVDFARRSDLLAGLDDTVAHQPGQGAAARLDLEKLLVTSRALRLRRRRPEVFTAGIEALAASGPSAGHVVAFARGGEAVTVATRQPAGLARSGGWADTVLELPPSLATSAGGQTLSWRDVLTETVHTGPRLVLSRLTEQLPVALLVPDPVAGRPDHVF
jgi:(1->4)-alpha-D-glucan 1-alpha-D-glucosylmutase